MDICAVEDPVAVADGKEDLTHFLDPLEHLAVSPSPDALGGQESGSVDFPLLNQCSGFLKPVAAEIRLTGNTIREDLSQGFYIVIAEFTAHDFIPEEGRIADDDDFLIGSELRPDRLTRMLWIAEVEQGIHEVEVVEFLQDRSLGDRVAIPPVPLEESDPEGHLGQLEGVGIDLESVKLPRPDGGEEGCLHSLGAAEEDNFFLQILQALEGDVEEVPGAAGRIENMDTGESNEEGVLDTGGLAEGLAQGGAGRFFLRRAWLGVLLSRLDEIRDGGAEGIPFPTQRGEQHWLDEILDVAPAGVFRTEGGSCGGIESALEEGAEDGGIDRSPVEQGGLVDSGDLGRLESEDDGIGEEASVEIRDGLVLELATLGHRAEELSGVASEAFGIVLSILEQVLKDRIGEESHILGKEAKDNAVKEPSRRLGVVMPRPETASQSGEGRSCFLGDRLGGASGAELLRVVEEVAEDFEIARSVELGGGKPMDRLGCAGEVRVYLDRVGVADDKKGRILQRGPIA